MIGLEGVGLIEVEVEDAAWAEVPGVEKVVVGAAMAALTHDSQARHGRACPGHPGSRTEPNDARPVTLLSLDAAKTSISSETSEFLGGRDKPGHDGNNREGVAPGPVTILLTDDATVRDLNARFRGKDYATNVLSFPAAPQPGLADPQPLGDLALAFGVCAAEAKAQGKTLADHLRHLVAHGVLHLLGHDHEDDDEAEAMEALEREILAGLGVADPYRADTLSEGAGHV